MFTMKNYYNSIIHTIKKNNINLVCNEVLLLLMFRVSLFSPILYNYSACGVEVIDVRVAGPHNIYYENIQ